MSTAITPRSAYIHVPFCRRRCGYCNFTLVADRDDLIDDYLRALSIELSGLQEPRNVDTIFLGGGTPSHLPLGAWKRLLKLISRWFPLAADGEWTVEANPEDISDAWVAASRIAGVNRISLGAQSFDTAKLARLERQHDAGVIRRAAGAITRSGSALSLDLIFAAPEETIDVWRNDLAHAIELSPQHISTYGLTYEKGAAFWSRAARGELRPLAEDREADMYELAIDHLVEAGHEHYEVSNFARPGFRCRHNESCWLGLPYFAAGPGAARYVAGRREKNHQSTTRYIHKVLAGESPVAEVDELDDEGRAAERFVFGMRRIEGVDLGEFRQATGFDVEAMFSESLRRFIDLELISRCGDRVRLTRRGLLLSDSLWPEFLR